MTLCILVLAGCSAPGAAPAAFDVTENLVAYYSFSGNANDSVGTAHGTLSGDVDLTASDRYGNPDSACAFDGTDDAVTIGTIPLGTSTGLSFALWMYRSNTGYAVYANPFFMYQQVTFCVYPGSTNSVYAAVPADTWTHIVGTYDNNTGTGVIKIYRDGALIEEVEKGSTLGSMFLNSLVLGERAGAYVDFQGVLDEVRIYNRVLTAAEVEAVYQYTE